MTINPNNYIGAAITLVGYVAQEPAYPAYDKEGKRGYKEISIPINEGYKKGDEFIQTGTTWYRISMHEDKVSDLDISKGAKIRLDGAKQEVREYKSRDGEDKLGITLSYGDLTVLEPGEGSSGDDSDTPF